MLFNLKKFSEVAFHVIMKMLWFKSLNKEFVINDHIKITTVLFNSPFGASQDAYEQQLLSW